MSIEKHKAFLDSLDGDKGLTEKLYSWYFDDDLEMVKCTINDGNTGRVLDYLFERIRRAESRQIPDLKEKVKELMRDAMNAAQVFEEYGTGYQGANLRRIVAFQEMCEPEKDSKEVKP